MVWEKGEIYVCSDPSCGLEITVNHASRHAVATTRTALCVCGKPMQRRLP